MIVRNVCVNQEKLVYYREENWAYYCEENRAYAIRPYDPGMHAICPDQSYQLKYIPSCEYIGWIGLLGQMTSYISFGQTMIGEYYWGGRNH